MNLFYKNGRIDAGGSCSTSVTLNLASSLSTGTYQYAPGHISYTLDGASYSASSAPTPLTVYGPPLVQKSFTDDPVTPGDPVTLEYTIINRDAAYPVTVRNNGPNAASGIKLLSQLPLELTLLSAYPSLGTYRRDSGIWLVDLLPPNAIAALELTVVPAAGTEALFAAEVSDVAENEIYTGNNRRQIQLQVNQGGSGEGGGCFLDNLLAR